MLAFDWFEFLSIMSWKNILNRQIRGLYQMCTT